MRKLLSVAAAAAATVIVSAGAANASVTVNPDGTGFVGKGDVQTVLGLNNKAIQGLDVQFTVNTVTTQSFDWTCTKVVVTGNGSERVTVQERANVTTTSTTGLLSSIARVKNQETGYNLLGFNGAPVVTETNDGPKVGSCPADQSEFDEGSIVEGLVVPVSGGLFVNGVSLPITPPAV